MTDNIDELARICYEAGVTPIDYAESCVKTAIDANELLGAPRDVLARRILAALLDAGWHPPVWPIPEPEPEAEPEPMPVGPVRVVPRLVIDRDELGFACLEADCPGCGATALIVNEWDAAECLSCTWREFEPPQEAS